ncbi:MAG: hypothetical protein ACK5LC_12815 [Coprobacillaceae bacterium]
MYSVGMFGENIYACEILTGFANIPEYHKISKNEFEFFEYWDKDMLMQIVNRPVFASGYKDNTNFDEETVRKMTW